MQPDLLVKQLCEVLPNQVRSIVLFGSAAAGDFIEGTSDYDLLIVLDRVTIVELEALGPVIQRWCRRGNPVPLIFAANQIALSVDAFAPEFLEMQQSRKVLFGIDPIANMTIDLAHVRIHLERELKGKLLALRNRFALAVGDRRRILSLLKASFSTFLSLFRLALRLYQSDVPKEKMDALHALAEHIAFDQKPFVIVDDIRRGTRHPDSVEINLLFDQYCQSVETVVQAIDRQLHSLT
jgi:hypothetical protein